MKKLECDDADLTEEIKESMNDIIFLFIAHCSCVLFHILKKSINYITLHGELLKAVFTVGTIVVYFAAFMDLLYEYIKQTDKIIPKDHL